MGGCNSFCWARRSRKIIDAKTNASGLTPRPSISIFASVTSGSKRLPLLQHHIPLRAGPPLLFSSRQGCVRISLPRDEHCDISVFLRYLAAARAYYRLLIDMGIFAVCDVPTPFHHVYHTLGIHGRGGFRASVACLYRQTDLPHGWRQPPFNRLNSGGTATTAFRFFITIPLGRGLGHTCLRGG